MNNRLLDALDLLKMLEVVFEQRQALELSGENRQKGGSNAFPWSGVRLTLRQSRELLEELQLSPRAPITPRQTQASPTSENLSFEQAVVSQHSQRNKASKEGNGDASDKNYRGTFNRIQLTQEPEVVSSDEPAAPVAR